MAPVRRGRDEDRPAQGVGPVEQGPRRRLFRLGLGDPGLRRGVDWEIEHHLAEETDQLMAEGWSREEARREAERRFGGVARQRRRLVATGRRGRAMSRGAEWGEAVWAGVRQALRGIRRSPGFAAGVVLTLGLGIGVNSAMFGLIDRLLLRPPEHVARPEQVRRIYREGEWLGTYTTTASLTYPDIQDLRTIPQFAAAGGYSGVRRVTLGAGEGASQVRAVLVTPDFFTTLGVEPRLGRFFTMDEGGIGASPTVVLSAEYWERSLGADPGILGRTLLIAGAGYTVVGVAPSGFTGTNLSPVDMWLPAVLSRYLVTGDDRFVSSRGYYWLSAVVRLGEGASVEEAEARATALNVNSRADEVERGSYDARTRLIVAPLIEARGPVASDTSRVTRWLAGVSLVVLLIACANAANLLLAQGVRRSRGMALRMALGAGRTRLLGVMAVESLLLAGLGGLVALAVAAWGRGLIGSLLVPDVLWSTSGQGIRMALVTAILAMVAGVLAGLGPAIRSTRADLSRDLVEGGRGSSSRRSRTRRVLTLTQAALSTVLLVGAGLFVRSLHEARTVDLGLDTDRLVLATLEFRTPNPDDADRIRLYSEAMARVRGVPGAEAVAVTDNPFQSLSVASLTLPGVDSLPVPRGRGPLYYSVSPGYFETVGLRILQGRTIQETDVGGAPRVALVNETMARILWPGQSALGQCFHFEDQEDCTTVVGVVQDASADNLDEDQYLAYYLPLAQTGFAPYGLYIRARGGAGALAADVAPVLRSFSPDVRYAEVQTLDDLLVPQRRAWVLGASLFTAFGVLALLVAAIGLYSLLAFDVAQRTREIGIRAALGAARARLLRDTLAQGTGIALIGTAIGLAICFLATPYVQPLLFHVEGRDPYVFGTVGVVLLGVAALASLGPGLRSTRADPAESLRVE